MESMQSLKLNEPILERLSTGSGPCGRAALTSTVFEKLGDQMFRFWLLQKIEIVIETMIFRFSVKIRDAPPHKMSNSMITKMRRTTAQRTQLS